jgi:hypothetical protein
MAPSEVQPSSQPSPPVLGPQLYLLTHIELRNSLRELIGGVELDADEVQPDRVFAGFASAAASEHSLSRLGVELWEGAIEDRLETIFASETERAALVGCAPSSIDEACVQGFLRDFGLKAWRRPLTEAEVERYHQVAHDTSADFNGSPWEGLRYAVQGLLQSPYFLSRVYVGEPDPARPGHLRLTSYELATKLAFALTQSPPDETLMQAAAAGQLSDRARVEAEVLRMLASEPARDTLREFCRELFSLTPLPLVRRSEEVIDELPQSLLQEMEEEVLHLCVEGLSGPDARSVFQATETSLGPELAALYGVEVPRQGMPVATAPLPDENRVGVLTTAGFLTALSHEDRTSPTLRGRFVRERLLCQAIPEPPEDAITDLPEPPSGQTVTMRERLEMHNVEPTCGACHTLMDPIGFALEHYDSVGRFRELDNGLPIDATGVLDGTAFDGAQELTAAVVNHDRLPQCLTTQWFRFSEARLENAANVPRLGALGDEFAASGFDFTNLIVRMALSEDFGSLTTE